MSAKIWAVGAGKGGVGKTFITSSLAITLSKLNQTVLVVDFDLAGANVHTHLGIPPASPTLQSYLAGEDTLATLIHTTAIPRLSFIQGVWDNWEHVQCKRGQGQKLIEEARHLPFDIVIFDLGPGATSTNLEIFKNADEKILVTTAEPTAFEKNYRFLEAWIIHEISENANAEALVHLKKSLKEFRSLKKNGYFSFRKYLSDANGFSPDHFASLQKTPVRLVLNSTRSHQDQQLGFSVKSVCNKFFDLEIDYAGFIDFDNAVWHSIRNREPFLIAKPFTALSGQFLSLSKALCNPEINANVFRAVI